eukprot:TRINITY_DN3908_c0_g1_i1.p1 TRINITY_DN3908_c0_g1~~TRINITY_DN3908_c0_g1_i1.p1  ORF type:complete len:277 (+),score=69.23 TRINITY_DN3908_c0_g1_i1:48-878(+)
MSCGSCVFGLRKGIGKAQEEVCEGLEPCTVSSGVFLLAGGAKRNSESLDSQQIIYKSRRTILDNLTARYTNNQKKLNCSNTRKSTIPLRLHQQTSEANDGRLRRERFVTEEDKDGKECVLEYVAAYKQIDSGLDESSTLAAKSDIDLNKVKEGTNNVYNKELMVKVKEDEDSLKEVMREALQRRKRLNEYENKLAKALEAEGILEKNTRMSLVVNKQLRKRHKARISYSKEALEKTIISSINKLLKPRVSEKVDLPSRPYVFKGVKTKAGVVPKEC